MATNIYHKRIDWAELTRTVEARPGARVPPDSSDASQRSDTHFSDSTWKQAIGWLRNGWLDGVKTAQEVISATPTSGAGPDWECDVAGFFPLVPAYIAGEPMCMMNRVETEGRRPRVTLAWNACYSASVEASQVLVYAAAIAQVIAELDAGGVDVAAYAVDACASGNRAEHHVMPIAVREYGQPFDLSRLVFTFHPSFLRRVLFAYRELDPVFSAALMAQLGYGHCISMTREHVNVSLGDAGTAAVLLPEVNALAGRGMLQASRLQSLVAELRELVRTA